jgi:hypothetical protein
VLQHEVKLKIREIRNQKNREDTVLLLSSSLPANTQYVAAKIIENEAFAAAVWIRLQIVRRIGNTEHGNT